MRVIFSPRSLQELTRISKHIADDNPRAADEFINQLEHRCSLLAGTPEMGGARPDIGRSVRALIHGNYLVFYRIRRDEEQVIILSVWHSRRRPPRLR